MKVERAFFRLVLVICFVAWMGGYVANHFYTNMAKVLAFNEGKELTIYSPEHEHVRRARVKADTAMLIGYGVPIGTLLLFYLGRWMLTGRLGPLNPLWGKSRTGSAQSP